MQPAEEESRGRIEPVVTQHADLSLEDAEVEKRAIW
jgi:hypothetical protein